MSVSRPPATTRSSRLAVLVVACLVGAAACGGSSSSSTSPTSPSQPTVTLQYVSVTGTFAIGAQGGTTQLRAMASTTSGSQDVTSQATWSSSNGAVATVSSSGLVSAAGTGLALITASYQGLSGYGGVSVATSVDLNGTWSGTSANPTSEISLRLVHAGDALTGTSTTQGGGVTYSGSLTGAANGGTVILSGSVSGPSGPYASWSDERCALENANRMRCVNPMTLAGGTFSLLQVTLSR